MPTVETEAEVLSGACVQALHSAMNIAKDPTEKTRNRLWAISTILDYAAKMPGLEDEEITEPTEEVEA
jgi:hypothetical protein